MAKKNKAIVVKDTNCLNCGYPFNQQENFCPECGQKNKGKKITLKSFISEVFAGFISWDAKFWKTLIPLLIDPGKVSKDYIEGKRNRYVNPFRFYITTSIVFFLILGATESYDKFNDLRKGTNKSSIAFNQNNNQEVDLDSIQKVVINEIEKAKIKDSLGIDIPLDSTTLKKIKEKENNFHFSLGGEKIDMMKYVRFHKKYPEIAIDAALDSLQLEKNFKNRFWYSRLKVFNGVVSNNSETGYKFLKQILSYASIALFILLPLFTLFLKIIYARRKYTYVEHLVFVFHVQTVFFLLFSIFYIIGYIKDAIYLIPIFLLLFIIYLFLAMKKFYNQGYLKTFIKYIMANTVFFFLATIGALIVSFIAFALY
ncbi:DUF3667 domain-containing protein [Tenacibaculum sp. S7007]|uniref:DUF3667 domain-containing protein n=1 Tax=Tenacibaculum pelagium TaxID=2759527 RepID=A0A839ALV7_9FLAO|nr:DUF3667 domain-containing protein [Tenacibaculum pelagium]MBA6156083.1 DUF3667 domain-containing protein [Tenacibaculum pelagium]